MFFHSFKNIIVLQDLQRALIRLFDVWFYRHPIPCEKIFTKDALYILSQQTIIYHQNSKNNSFIQDYLDAKAMNRFDDSKYLCNSSLNERYHQ